MAKIKVHELAKELELQSKDILNFLQEKGIEAKAAQSSLEEDAAALVRNSLGQKKAAAAPAAEKEAPAKAENTKPAEEKAQEETKSPGFVDVAPAHMGDIAFIRPESAANFRDFFFVHFDILLFLILFLKTHLISFWDSFYAVSGLF